MVVACKKKAILVIAITFFYCSYFLTTNHNLLNQESIYVKTSQSQVSKLVMETCRCREEKSAIIPTYKVSEQFYSFHEVGIPQTICSCWKKTEIHSQITNNSNLMISDQEGLLYRFSTNITEIETSPINSSLEDFEPSLASNDFFISSDEFVYMGFQINGSESVTINGFWIYLRGESRGDMTYQLFNSIPGNDSVTYPNVTSPISTQLNKTITPLIEVGEEQWVWLDFEQEFLTLNPLTTYANTFYLGIWRTSTSSRIRWVYCNDDFSPDNEDEGDCYSFYGVMTYQEIDLFMNVSISPLSTTPFPSTINMKINNILISDQIFPGTGWWESGELNPAVNTSVSPEDLLITYCWNDYYQWIVYFKIVLEMYFYENDLAQTEFQIDSEHTSVAWKISFPIEYPITSENQKLNISLGNDWSVETVKRNSVVHTIWMEYSNHLLIEEVKEGIWEIECTAPNYMYDVDFVNSNNEVIFESDNDDLIRICCSIKDSEENLVTNGYCNLTINDPKNRPSLQIINHPIEVGSKYNCIFQWDLSTLESDSGVYIVNLIWTNGTAAGVVSSSITITILDPLLKEASPYLISFSSIVFIIGVSIILYRFILIPKKRERDKYLRKLKNSFTDAIKLKRLLIIHKQTGLCILDPIFDKNMDANLMGGLLHAISTFGGSIIGTVETSSDSSVDPELKDITYGDNHIRIYDGDFVRTAAIFSGIPSIQVNLMLEKFTNLFETSHSNELRKWTGTLKIIPGFDDIIEEIFFISLNNEYRLTRRKIEIRVIKNTKERLQNFFSKHRIKEDRVLLNRNERRILDFIVEFQKNKEILLLGDIMHEYMKNRKKGVVDRSWCSS